MAGQVQGQGSLGMQAGMLQQLLLLLPVRGQVHQRAALLLFG